MYVSICSFTILKSNALTTQTSTMTTSEPTLLLYGGLWRGGKRPPREILGGANVQWANVVHSLCCCRHGQISRFRRTKTDSSLIIYAMLSDVNPHYLYLYRLGQRDSPSICRRAGHVRDQHLGFSWMQRMHLNESVKTMLCPLFGEGELGPHLTHGRGLPPCEVAS